MASDRSRIRVTAGVSALAGGLTALGGVLRSFRERLLGPLLAYDERHRAELLPTLRQFLTCSGSWNACAAAMDVHVNTVRYRIRRIEDLTGLDCPG